MVSGWNSASVPAPAAACCKSAVAAAAQRAGWRHRRAGDGRWTGRPLLALETRVLAVESMAGQC